MDSINGTYIPMKRAEISINKFNDVGIPHHINLLNNHRLNIEKSLAIGDWDKVKKEEINAMRVIKQLKNVLVEMDKLRGSILQNELERFDALTMVGRQKIQLAIQEYIDLEKNVKYKQVNTINSDEIQQNIELEHLPQIQSEFQLNEHQLRSREACLIEFENLQREIQDIQELFIHLSGSIVQQKDNVQLIDDNVTEAQVHVHQAEKSLRQALTYKKAMYPLCGAVLGFCVAGPVGMVAFGLKAGSLAAVGCGVLGATGGAALKNKQEPEMETVPNEQPSEVN